jgi:hypothetical protein
MLNPFKYSAYCAVKKLTFPRTEHLQYALLMIMAPISDYFPKRDWLVSLGNADVKKPLASGRWHRGL